MSDAILSAEDVRSAIGRGAFPAEFRFDGRAIPATAYVQRIEDVVSVTADGVRRECRLSGGLEMGGEWAEGRGYVFAWGVLAFGDIEAEAEVRGRPNPITGRMSWPFEAGPCRLAIPDPLSPG